MKAVYEANVNGTTYEELAENAWKEVAALFSMSVEEAKKLLYAEMHIRRTLENQNFPYAGSIFFSYDPSKETAKD
jgi:predicted nuclease of restriction endonuclease-like RecB superfamily